MFITLQSARNNEMQFFQSNSAYAGCTNIGTDFLSTKLSSQLVRAIQQQLPVITTSIDNGCARHHAAVPSAPDSLFWHCIVEALSMSSCPVAGALVVLATHWQA